MDITTHIEIQATESAAELDAQGWEGNGDDYDIGAFSGDLEALERRLGREATREETCNLEAAIRRLLDRGTVERCLGYALRPYGTGKGEEVIVFVPGEHAHDLRRSFDSVATIGLLRAAADALESGDGIEATRKTMSAWARIALFHKES